MGRDLTAFVEAPSAGGFVVLGGERSFDRDRLFFEALGGTYGRSRGALIEPRGLPADVTARVAARARELDSGCIGTSWVSAAGFEAARAFAHPSLELQMLSDELAANPGAAGLLVRPVSRPEVRGTSQAARRRR